MDDRTLRLLEFPKIRDRLMEQTVTASGRDRAAALRPFVDPEEVRRALAETAEARALGEDGEVPLRGTTDIREAVRRAAIGAALDAGELLNLRQTLRTIRQCKGFVTARRERAPYLAEVAGRMATFAALEEAIGRTVAEDGSIPDGASAGLARIRRERRTTQARLREKLDEVLRGPYGRMLQDPLITSRGERYVVPVRAEFKGTFPGILHDQSSSGATVFMEPLAVVPLGNRLRELEIEEREEIARLLRALSAQVGERSAEILHAYEALGQIDFAVAKARLADAMEASRPVVRDDGALRFVAARHPLLTGKVVPVDVRLGEEFTTLVITGPNTGGKTVTLRTIGLLTLMAQSGLFIPAAEGSEAAVFPQVFADIGDEQSIEQSLSTFSSHMGAIAEILRRIRGPALVLLDEIGAGTDPTEGVALARAILEHLHARGCRTAVTTHYHELKSLAYTLPGVQNASVEFDPQTLAPTYRLLIGLPGRSNALIIAARLGVDPAVVERSRALLGAGAVEIDRILGEIEANRRAGERELARAAEARREAEVLRDRLQAELARLQAERRKILARAREEGEALILRARREIEAILHRVRSTGSPETVRRARADLRRVAEDLPVAEEASSAEPGEAVTDVRPGQPVYIVPLRRAGTVLTAPDSRGAVDVDTGGIRVTVGLAGLRRAAAAPPSAGRPETPAPQGEMGAGPAVPLSLNLRGETVDEALAHLDKYLDEAFLAGLSTVTVIHGKGTGTLRRAVHGFLAHHPQVKSFRLGERGEGEGGVTIVELDVR
ncbi:MAG: endonuclease MutS2 [Armatimonadota bacterium]|nr:endonuclease MutS2 [Armatimonadota bacterium]MDR7452283.1 endonuclease MutS2 [Armatimonadota bacterium]MDR7467953.1 endonuclease MutS2 [Armatimonadota bacterium]MDR7494795.1 endonuclease MutS2 [Armatimonadota bacterium]MDR7499250.1 endonuclease MutS2 [Armatimonadota bacterium]